MTTAADLAIVQVPIDELHPDPANPRTISSSELDALTRSIREFGLIQPILARCDDKIVIGGHQRLLAARRLGWKTVPVIFLDITDEQARLLNLALNRISGDWDEQLLARLLADLHAVPDVDLSLSSFSDEELKRLLKRIEADDNRERLESFDLDAAFAETEHHPITQPGDLWLLGDHRLLCGDATKEEDAARLMAGKSAALMATDPPYLVDYQGGERPASNTNGGRISGSKRSTASATKKNAKHWDAYHDPATSVAFFVNFLRVGLAHLDPHAAIYQWHASRRQALVEQAWGSSASWSTRPSSGSRTARSSPTAITSGRSSPASTAEGRASRRGAGPRPTTPMSGRCPPRVGRPGSIPPRSRSCCS